MLYEKAVHYNFGGSLLINDKLTGKIGYNELTKNAWHCFL